MIKLLRALFKKPKQELSIMLYFSPEQLVDLKAQYEFAAKSLGYFRDNINYYTRLYGPAYINSAISQLESEKLKLEVQVDFLTNYLS